jgi:hypothetical protein
MRSHKGKDSVMAIPLVMTGPGGDYVNQYRPRGKRIVRTQGQQGETESNGGHTAWSKLPKRKPSAREQPLSVGPATAQPDRFEHTEPTPQPGLYRPNSADPKHGASAQSPQASMAVLSEVIGAWLQAQRRSLVRMSEQTLTLKPISDDAHQRAVAKVLRDLENVGALTAPLEKHHELDPHQSHAQADEHPHPHPRPAAGTRLFPDDAGTRRRTGRQQGHHLRARRGADQKRRLAAAGQQGTLFGG